MHLISFYDIPGKLHIAIVNSFIASQTQKNIKHVVTWYMGKHLTFKNRPQTYAISRLRNYEMEFIKRHIIT